MQVGPCLKVFSPGTGPSSLANVVAHLHVPRLGHELPNLAGLDSVYGTVKLGSCDIGPMLYRTGGYGPLPLGDPLQIVRTGFDVHILAA